MTAVGVDTPDGQRGVVSAQLLLAGPEVGNQTIIVGIPPNAETLIINANANGLISDVVCGGVGSGVNYPVMKLANRVISSDGDTWVIDASSVVDSQVAIVVTALNTGHWYVYADSGVHVVVDRSKLVSKSGVQYATLVPPATGPGDRPPVELRYLSGLVAAGGIVAPSLGATLHYRIFSAQLITYAGTLAGYLIDAAAGQAFLFCTPTSSGQASYSPSGLLLTVNTGVTFTVLAGAGNVAWSIVYTAEVT